MAYKDKDRQREANAERQRRYKEKQKALLSEGVTVTKCESNVGVTDISAVKALHQLIRKRNDSTKQGSTRAFIEGRDKRPETGKRGKDSKSQSYNPMMVGYVPPQERGR